MRGCVRPRARQGVSGERSTGNSVIIANKSGAAGAVGMQSVAVAKPDGYTLLITVPSLHTLPEVDKLFGRAPTFTRDQFVPMEMILSAAGGLKMRHLPTAGGGPATTAVLGGHADLWASTIGPATGHIKSGKIRPLAVTSVKRHEAFPDVPTLKELGYDVEYYLWIGLFVAKATPPPIIKVLRDAARQAVEDPTFRTAIEKLSSD